MRLAKTPIPKAASALTAIPCLLAAASCLLACQGPGESSYGALGTHRLLLRLPDPPAAWVFLPELTMTVTWRDPGGRARSLKAEPGAELGVEVGRGRPQAILALPSSAGRELLPAGALYPEALSGGFDDELSLGWKGGYAASLALALMDRGIDPWGYDLQRLAEEATERCGDPWLVPAIKAARALAELEFRIDAYRKPRRMAVDLPDSGPWAPESPFEELPVPNGASASTALLSEGLWRFVGQGGELFASVDAEGRVVFVRR